MSTEDPKPDNVEPEPETTAAPRGEAPPTPPEPELKWEYKETLPINDRMKDVIKATIKASECQLELMRRKLKKLQYGS
jgi:hypothetical protein